MNGFVKWNMIGCLLMGKFGADVTNFLIGGFGEKGVNQQNRNGGSLWKTNVGGGVDDVSNVEACC